MRTFRVTTVTAAVALMFAIAASTASAQLSANWSPTSLSFGKQKVGTKSGVKTVTVRGQCGPDIDIDPGPGFTPAPGPCSNMDIAVSGDFLISATTCPLTGVLAGVCTIDVRFKPKSKGKKEGFLRIQSIPFGGVPLDGKGCKKKEDGKLKECKKG